MLCDRFRTEDSLKVNHTIMVSINEMIQFLTLPMLSLRLSKAQGCKNL